MAVSPFFPQGNSIAIIPGQVPQQIPGFYPCDNNNFEAGGIGVVFSNNLPAASVGVAGNVKKLTPQNPGAVVGGIPTDARLGGPNPNVLPTQATAGVLQGAAASGGLSSTAQGAAGQPQGQYTTLAGNSTGQLGLGQLTVTPLAN
jgi:hypothetical protein